MAKRIDKSGMSKRSGATINNATASQISDESRKRKSPRKLNDCIHRIDGDDQETEKKSAGTKRKT